MKIDENTGLPELPEGYFWRIRPDTAGTKIHRMRKRTLLPAISTGSTYVFPHHHLTPTIAVRFAAQIVLRELTNDEALRPLRGDYPPKKLEK